VEATPGAIWGAALTAERLAGASARVSKAPARRRKGTPTELGGRASGYTTAQGATRSEIARIVMATTKQVRAARANVKKAQQAATKQRTIARLPESTRRGLQEQARRGRQRGGQAGHALEDRNRQQLYEIAKQQDIPGRSKMGKWELIDAIRERR